MRNGNLGYLYNQRNFLWQKGEQSFDGNFKKYRVLVFDSHILNF
jgi:phosphoribosyl-AMP cyclohydrolase